MTSRGMLVLLGLSLLMNTFVLAGFVYRSWIAPPHEMARPAHLPPPPGPRPSPLESLAGELDLDPRQRLALRDVFDRYAETRRERAQEIQKVRDQVAAAMRQPAFDLARIEALVDRMSRLRADQQKENVRTFALLEPELRPQQRERMHMILAERFAGPQAPLARQAGASQPPPPPPRPLQ